MRIFALLVLALLLAGCSAAPAPSTAAPPPKATSTTPSVGPATTTPGDVTPTSSTPSGGGAYPAMQTVVVATSRGVFAFKLDPQDAPQTSAHIADLVQRRFYDGLPFHRYVEGVLIQGGDPDCKGDITAASCGHGGSGQTVPLEATTRALHDQGAVALALPDGPNSGDSQFYVVTSPQGAHDRDGTDTVFGTVTDGMDVVDSLRAGDFMTHVALSNGDPSTW